MISLDTETTGLDLYHGARPFFLTVCREDGQQEWYEWDVDPLTRKVSVPEADKRGIGRLVESADGLVLQNAKFDVAMLREAGCVKEWPWGKTYDTLLAGHLLASNQPHDLTSMAIQYLGIDIEPYEVALKKSMEECRRYCRSKLPEWRIAKAGLPEMPSAKGSCWKYDGWLPKRLAQELGHPDDHPWHTVLRDYANTDSAVTLSLWGAQRAEIKRRGLWEIYLEPLKVLPVACDMERGGVTVSKERLDRLRKEYESQSSTAGRICTNIAASYGYDLTLPKSGNNKSLTGFVFGPLGLPPLKLSRKTGAASLDKGVIEAYQSVLPERSKQAAFVRALRGKRKRDTALAYMEGYEKFWLPKFAGGPRHLIKSKMEWDNWFVLHPSLNPTGTDTLRWSSSQPNEQNISKQEGFNLRYVFGPAPGREWWSLDAKNIELRIPAYEAGEREMVALFERPENPPYYGSNHLLVFDILYPELFAKHGKEVKTLYESTYYQWVKNGNFAVQYGAMEESGTADRAYHLKGAQRRVQERFRNIKILNESCIRFAEKNGYVETIPDKTVNPHHGYPLLCTRTEYGCILPTVPLNYRVQGTAMWWMAKAMVRCWAKLQEWNKEGFDGRIALQVHDELVFDFPKRGDPTTDASKERNGRAYFRTSNLWRVRILQKLMEQGGEDIEIPTPVSVEYHADNWSEGVTL